MIIPEFQEPIHILRRTLENLSHQDYPRERMIIILATETKDPNSQETALLLKQGMANFLATS